jgi:nicotinamide-nucleotide adenylyltransferase
MKALFIGRFQPLHLGHCSAIEYVSRVADHVLIGIGSSQEKNTLENPFSYNERLEMVKRSLKLNPSRYEIHPIPDFHDDVKWLAHIKEKMPAFDVVYTNAPREKKIFRNAGIMVISIPFYNRPVYNATNVRKVISSGGRWEILVPKASADVIKKVAGVKRITDLMLK